MHLRNTCRHMCARKVEAANRLHAPERKADPAPPLPRTWQGAWCWLAVLALAAVPCLASAYTNLPAAYSALGFDPHHPGNRVVVLFSDPHMNLWADVLPVVTNLDPRLVNVINSMDPPPAKILVSGDTSTTLSPVPGWQPQSWSMQLGMNEMRWWLSAIRAITNVSQTDILWIPGNHDQLHTETNAETYRAMYPTMPTRQALDIAGVRFFLLNCGNYGGRDPDQAAWLADWLSHTPTNQPVVIVTHVPPFLVPGWYRGLALELRDLFAEWPAKWWTFSGHYHGRSLNVYQIGRSRVASMVVGTASPNNTNGKSYDAGGLFVCLSNGVAGIVYYHYNDGSFEAVAGPDWGRPQAFKAAFEGTPGLLWRRLKSRGRPPEVVAYTADDAIEWYAYTRWLEWVVPLTNHQNQATAFVLLATLPSSNAVLKCQMSNDVWATLPLPTPSNFVYQIPLPDTVRTQPVVRLRYTGSGLNDFIGGWGLATTNPPPWPTYPQLLPIPDLVIEPGETVDLALRVTNPYAPPDRHRFALLTGPAGAVLDQQSGRFRWTSPTNPSVPSLLVTIKVEDDGTPPFCSTQQFALRFAGAFSWRSLVSTGSVWRYNDLEGDPGDDWRGLDCDDSLWEEGPAPLGFGNTNEATVLPNGARRKPVTVYFRRDFVLPQSPWPPDLTGRLWCDDGAVVYLNGVEIFRHNLPPGPIRFDTPAMAAVTPEAKQSPVAFTVPAWQSRPGANVLAVEMHRAVPQSEPVAFWTLDEPEAPWLDVARGHDFTRLGATFVSSPGVVGHCVSNRLSTTTYLWAADTPDLRYTGPFTVGAWCAFGVGTDQPVVVLAKSNEFGLFYTGTGVNRYRFQVGTTTVQDQTSGTQSGQWRFVVAWYDGANASIQINNGLVYSAPASPPTPGNQPLVALKKAGPSGSFAVDELFFYKRVLTASERAAIYELALRQMLATNRADLLFDLELTTVVAQPPAFTDRPASLVRRVGENAGFLLTAHSSTPVAYQWQFNGVPIAGATDTLLFLPAVTPTQAGLYALVASNAGGAVTSAPARLTVVVPPVLAAHQAAGGTGLELALPACEVASTLLASTNLVNWEAVLERPAGAGVTNWPVTPQPGVPQRYYRLRLEW